MDDFVSAAETNDLDRLRRLLELERAQNPRLGQNSSVPSTPAMQAAHHAAARCNHPAALELLFDNGAWIGPGPLEVAVRENHKDIFKALVARGWNVSSNLGHAGDALVLAVREDNLDLVQFLLSHGADPNANFDIFGWRSLEVAVCWSSIPVIEALLNAGAKLKGSSALQRAAYTGRTDVLVFLLDRGAPIDEIPDNIFDDEPRPDAKSALCEAAWRGQTEVVKILLERGADASFRAVDGRSALELAEAEGHESCVEVLKGAC
ncbi:uncharacterized protein K452DRAFT_315586 [Aplosporella prunicola CBS 121167]|uniref:Uncharacterized protein n=1 Tax=Aplosporella prunicola CBS 121167 TaxID=1176127 RepID=A0A6A6BRV5_9PEZI|nr:uncharacterized protein K452DRAFT_315586 [Aplosporella prunicola CBS 121167]KAF2145311.1 hypothetical protein K452DRAFT_315586 [Aplosporella prunicola CBS 121167]